MPSDAYYKAGEGLGKGAIEGLDDYMKTVAEKRKRRDERQGDLEKAAITAGTATYDTATGAVRPVEAPSIEALNQRYPDTQFYPSSFKGGQPVISGLPRGLIPGSGGGGGGGVDGPPMDGADPGVSGPSPYELQSVSFTGGKPTVRYGQAPQFVQQAQMQAGALGQTMTNLKTKFYEVKQTESGPQGLVEGARGAAEAALGRNPGFKAYEALRKAVLGQAAAAVSKEGGRLTQQDIERIEGAIPSLVWDTRQDADQKFGVMEEQVMGVVNEVLNRQRALRGQGPMPVTAPTYQRPGAPGARSGGIRAPLMTRSGRPVEVLEE